MYPFARKAGRSNQNLLFRFGVLAAAVVALRAQSPVSSRPVAWSRVGNTGVSKALAGPAGGKILGVWYSASGEKLFVQTEAGRVFETADLEHWQLNQSETAPAQSQTYSAGREFRLGEQNLYATENNGQTWINLTGLNNVSVVGAGADVLAANPQSPQEIAIGNAFGAWRSADGGLTWTGLNERLPNFPAVKLLSQRSVLLKDGTAATWNAGAWTPVTASASEASARIRATARIGSEITAVGSSVSQSKDSLSYAGSFEGRLFVSRDAGAHWLESPRVSTNAVQRFWIDPDRPDVALAISGNHLFRTVNAGGFWDDVTGSMPAITLNAVTADRSASLIYAATDRGVYSASLSLNDAGDGSIAWTSVSGELPAARALDISYNIDGTLTVVLDGYGVYETVAPHRSRGVRLLSGADLTERPAAPGSLVSVTGARVQTATGGSLTYPVLLGSDSSTQLQVPFECAPGVITLALGAGSDHWSLPLTVKESAPAIFVDADGAPLLTDAETGLVIDPKTALHSGQHVQVMATGLGKVSPEWPTGAPGPSEGAPAVKGVVLAFLDGVPLEVSRAVLAAGYVGYYTVEMQLPQVLNRGASELTLVMNGERSNHVRVYVEPAPL